ncbi:VOC family protein [Clostridium sp. Mt-5]|uniref:Aldoketomutase n=1 Tax=Clostridium moutaii TaxID=3240932 RepID=A0ABV4BME9_9CLOT
MKFVFDHNNINVLNLDKSIEFYKKALGFKEVKRKEADDKSFTLVFMGDGVKDYKIELTWLKDRREPYNLGDNEIHMAVRTDDLKAAHEYHKKMGCICYENKKMGLYFIADPDGYWTEILPIES